MSTPSVLLGPIVGGLSHNRANIWARADSPSTLHIWLAAHADLSDTQLIGQVELLPEDGCAGIVSLERLEPEKKYYYAVSLRNVRPAQNDFHSFTTFPEPRTPRSFSFAFGSCYLPPDERGGETMDELNRRIEPEDLRFGLFLGDQIYADRADLNGIGQIAVTLDEYRAVYEYAWRRPVMRALLPSLPLFMTLDDHEVDDDWRWLDSEHSAAAISAFERFFRWLKGLPSEQRRLSPERVHAALKAYHEHQAIHAPGGFLPLETNPIGESRSQSQDTVSFAYAFYLGGAAFFVLDTRTMRVKDGKRSMLGEAQWTLLQEWLKEANSQYPIKFLVSSATILHPFWLDLTRDRWNGFPVERERLLEFLAVNEIEGLHILTGDLHSAHAVSAELKCPGGRRIPIWEFCSTPFEQSARLAAITYRPLSSKWIGNQKRLFQQTGRNFGIIHVDFDASTPHVTFTLHYDQNGWKIRPPIATILKT